MRAISPVFLLMLAGCDLGAGEGRQAHVLAVLPYTGTFEVKAQLHEEAIRMALEELVEAGAHDRMDRQFNVVPVNAGDGPDVVRTQVEAVIDELGDDVLGIISSTGDAHEGSVWEAMDHHIPHFETSSGAHDEEFVDWDEVGDESLSYLLSSRALCNYEAIYTAEFIMQRWPTATVALLRGDKEHDKMHTRVIRATLRDLGFQGTVVEAADPLAAAEPWEDNRKDLMLSYDALESGGVQATLGAVIDQYHPDVMFWHLRGDATNLRFVQDAERANFTGDLVTCGMVRTPEFIDPDENGLISDYLANRFFFVMRSPLPGPELDRFRTDFEKRTGLISDTFAPSVYDAALIWGLGVVGAEDFTGEAVRDSIVEVSQQGEEVSRTDLGKALLLASQGEDIDYQGAGGPMDVRPDRTVPGSYYVEEVVERGGSFEYEELSVPPRVTK